MVRRNRISALATSRRVAWKRRSSRFRARLNKVPMYFSNMASVASASLGFEARGLDNEDRRPSRGFELGDVRNGQIAPSSTNRARRAA